MEKITFTSEEMQEKEEFYVLEQTKIKGISYILVTDSKEDDAECMILRDMSSEEEGEGIYEVVEDDEELAAIAKVFEELLDRVDLER